MNRSPIHEYYDTIATREVEGGVHELVRFRLPHTSNAMRRRIIKKVLEESGADALIECSWSKGMGSLIYKEKWQFYAILVFNGDKVRPCQSG